ncbi:MAG: hypothetical protein H6754_06800 [Candidatus Omnitrophica bacterium]|nr:hypothetical protein [Candidatus Omnitrophota bacterium]
MKKQMIKQTYIELDRMMDCVKEAFLNGSQRGDEFHKMRHAIVVELKRLGYEKAEIKQKLIEWNERCERPLGLSEQKIQLCGYVDWVFQHDCKVGCRAMFDYCLGKERCRYCIHQNRTKYQRVQQLPFNYQELRAFLEERYKAQGYGINMVLDTLLWFQKEQAKGELIYISYRKICSLILERYNSRPDPKDVYRKIQILILEGVIEKVVVGKKGMFSKLSNGYRFLPWTSPTHNNSYVCRDGVAIFLRNEKEDRL